ncbi:MAG: hypothetical protein ALECFALPRED_000986 [Alectoria fallacina]|uniref:Triacylglycerol lipase n=1 Tax=Alectoria fallacina TaxID=1903189 RepID=A0A8H3IHQ7_9LECA|nr:MAG: hypothetical protein ALECFALPRED_000986 [Alectoria fallacina]
MLYISPSKLAAAVIVLFFSCSLAAPLERRAIDATTFANLQLFEQFAAASYCPGNDNVTAGGTKLTCATDNCPLVAADDVTTVYEFENPGLLTGVTGYVAVDHTLALTILAFRGSHTFRNWAADLDFVQIPTDICPHCFCHQGFYNSWLEARPGVLAALLTTAHQYPTYRVTIVGHSLGGAIADVAAAEIRKAGTPADLYTYGAPRIAGPVLSDYITDQKAGGNYRTTHYDDPVPRLPPRALGFVHISPEYYIDTVTGVVPTAANVTALYGNVNLNGNTGNDKNKTDVLAHGWYFNHVSAC